MSHKINVSFKADEWDMYAFVVKQLSASIYIKQLIKDDMIRNQKELMKNMKNTPADTEV